MLNVYLGDLFLVGGINDYFEDMLLSWLYLWLILMLFFRKLAYYAARFEHSCL
jgi:hypothetical protein